MLIRKLVSRVKLFAVEHDCEVLTGQFAREAGAPEPFLAYVKCSCGYECTALHGQEGEELKRWHLDEEKREEPSEG